MISFPPGSDEMSINTRAFDWAATSLGPIEDWSDSLRALVAMMLGSAQPMFMAWGEERRWFYNEAFIPILGVKHPSALGRPISEVWAEAWSDLRPLIDQVFTGSSIHMTDINLLLDRRGMLEEAHFSFSYNPAFDAEGHPCGLFGVCTETTDQVIAQRELLKSEERLQLALSAGNSIGTWDWDVMEDRVTADSRFAQIYGVDEKLAARGAPLAHFFTRVHSDDLAHLQVGIDDAVKTGKPFSAEYRLTQEDGSVRWVAVQGQAIMNEETGAATRFPGVTFDITERKRAEAQQAILRAELQHRNKNLMAMILAISAQTLRGDDIKTRRDAFNERLMALGRAQDVLTAASWSGANIRDIIDGSVSHLGDRFDIEGPPLKLDAKRALSLALATHELGTNAVKYGALSAKDGRVGINWWVGDAELGAPKFRFEWREIGGPAVTPPERQGFGSRLIKRVLGADFEGDVAIGYDRDGVTVRLNGLLQSSEGLLHGSYAEI